MAAPQLTPQEVIKGLDAMVITEENAGDTAEALKVSLQQALKANAQIQAQMSELSESTIKEHLVALGQPDLSTKLITGEVKGMRPSVEDVKTALDSLGIKSIIPDANPKPEASGAVTQSGAKSDYRPPALADLLRASSSLRNTGIMKRIRSRLLRIG